MECQVDFAQRGLLSDPETGRAASGARVDFTAELSRHMFVWLTYSQILTAVVAGSGAAWGCFSGVFKVRCRTT